MKYDNKRRFDLPILPNRTLYQEVRVRGQGVPKEVGSQAARAMTRALGGV